MKLYKVSSQFTKELWHNRLFLDRIHTNVRLNYRYDIPYLAGYSNDGKVIYFDRHLKRHMNYKGKNIDISMFLVVHEVVEKALIDLYRFNYQRAHHIAKHFEHLSLKNYGINWWVYTKFLNPQIKFVYKKKKIVIPHDLDLTPYIDSKDKILQRIQKSEPINNQSTDHVIPMHDTGDWKEDITDKEIDIAPILGTRYDGN